MSGGLVAKSYPCDPMDCSLLGFSVHGIFQATVLEWLAIPFSRGSSRSRDRTRVSYTAYRKKIRGGNEVEACVPETQLM